MKSKNQIALPFDKPERKKPVDIMQIIRAPWTEHQVENLNMFQVLDSVHPFTCFTCYDVNLIATKNGWICPVCDYTQDWAHAIMMDDEFLSRAKIWKNRIANIK